MNPIESYQVVVLGGGKGGKTLAIELGQKGVKTALIERSAEMIGGVASTSPAYRPKHSSRAREPRRRRGGRAISA